MTADDLNDLLPPLDGHPGPAQPVSEARARELVAAAIDRAMLPAPAPSAPVTSGLARYLLVGAAAAALGLAAAWYLWGRKDRAVESPPVQRELAVAVEAPGSVDAAALAPQPDARAADSDEAEYVFDEDAVDAIEIAKARSSEDLLALANRARGKKAWERAARLYERVRKEHPRTGAAYVATVSEADLRLEHLRDLEGALRLYRRAQDQRPKGSLGAEILRGQAEVWRRRTKTKQELAALRKLVSRYPKSIAAEAAAQRIAEIEGGQ